MQLTYLNVIDSKYAGNGIPFLQFYLSGRSIITTHVMRVMRVESLIVKYAAWQGVSFVITTIDADLTISQSLSFRY